MAPVSKFFAVKFVVFVTWWQEFSIEAMVQSNVIKANGDFSARQEGVRLQNLIICLEMMVTAIAHGYIYNIRECHKAWHVMHADDDGEENGDRPTTKAAGAHLQPQPTKRKET